MGLELQQKSTEFVLQMGDQVIQSRQSSLLPEAVC